MNHTKIEYPLTSSYWRELYDQKKVINYKHFNYDD